MNAEQGSQAFFQDANKLQKPSTIGVWLDPFFHIGPSFSVNNVENSIKPQVPLWKTAPYFAFSHVSRVIFIRFLSDNPRKSITLVTSS